MLAWAHDVRNLKKGHYLACEYLCLHERSLRPSHSFKKLFVSEATLPPMLAALELGTQKGSAGSLMMVVGRGSSSTEASYEKACNTAMTPSHSQMHITLL